MFASVYTFRQCSFSRALAELYVRMHACTQVVSFNEALADMRAAVGGDFKVALEVRQAGARGSKVGKLGRGV